MEIETGRCCLSGPEVQISLNRQTSAPRAHSRDLGNKSPIIQAINTWSRVHCVLRLSTISPIIVCATVVCFRGFYIRKVANANSTYDVPLQISEAFDATSFPAW